MKKTSHIKNLAINFFDKLGYRIEKKIDFQLELYQKLFDLEDLKNKRFYNIGAGNFRHPFWTNIDYFSDWYRNNPVDISIDLLKFDRFPIESDTANICYSSHTVEHINDDAASKVFLESYRILKKGGFLRLTTPNIDLYYKALQHNYNDFWQWEISNFSIKENYERIGIRLPMNSVSLKQIFLYSFASQLSILHADKDYAKIDDEEFDEIFNTHSFTEALNLITSRCRLDIQYKYPGNHINWWNKDKLFKMLTDAGFNEIYLSGYNQSLNPVLRNKNFFDNRWPQYSIYVEAIK